MKCKTVIATPTASFCHLKSFVVTAIFHLVTLGESELLLKIVFLVCTRLTVPSSYVISRTLSLTMPYSDLAVADLISNSVGVQADLTAEAFLWP